MTTTERHDGRRLVAGRLADAGVETIPTIERHDGRGFIRAHIADAGVGTTERHDAEPVHRLGTR
ncbi:hypothetical protein ACFO0N_00140 [Halobium salinum]|uniref:Uncharacterized protein n=1 Tax=Halobium salinum TaxID=1364940 RepID=A0ABD5P630_9EURY|nr:hypothetical protein [Halobium salinum]